MQKQKHKSPGLHSVPSMIQLPGGVTLKAMPFKIVSYNDDGTPRAFELQPPGPHDMAADGACVLFAREDWIRSPMKKPV
jgi:hypothetical protein